MISKDKRHVAENLSDFLVIKDANSLLYDLTTNYAFTYKLKTFIISFFQTRLVIICRLIILIPLAHLNLCFILSVTDFFETTTLISLDISVNVVILY